EEYGDVQMVSLSHEVHAALPEFERTSTTVVNAYIGPKVNRYLRRLDEQLREDGYGHELLVMQRSGGIATAALALHRPIATLAGGLQVGPESAGSDPGPVCYGRGGNESTVTDANLVLGYLNPDYFAGGEFPLKADGVVELIEEQVGRPLGLDGVEAAWGIHRL